MQFYHPPQLPCQEELQTITLSIQQANISTSVLIYPNPKKSEKKYTILSQFLAIFSSKNICVSKKNDIFPSFPEYLTLDSVVS